MVSLLMRIRVPHQNQADKRQFRYCCQLAKTFSQPMRNPCRDFDYFCTLIKILSYEEKYLFCSHYGFYGER